MSEILNNSIEKSTLFYCYKRSRQLLYKSVQWKPHKLREEFKWINAFEKDVPPVWHIGFPNQGQISMMHLLI